MSGKTRIGPLAQLSAYFRNAEKELAETMSASQEYKIVRGDNTVDEKKKKKKFQQERGQWAGALLQGRRYNQSGKQQ